MRREIVHAINLTPYYVLWQSDIEHFDLPEGKHLEVAWVPQQSVLNHTNIRLFITHGGLSSLYEAMYFKVPIIGIPFTGEQCYYLNHAVNSGWALRLDYKNISLFSLKWAIETVTEEISMKDQAFYANILLRDQMYRPIDKAIHYVNYVLRHGGRQMRSHALYFDFFTYHSLDTALIWIILAVILAKIVAFVYYLSGIEIYKFCQDFGRKYNETFFGSGYPSPSPPQQDDTIQKSYRQPVPKKEQQTIRKRRAKRREDLNLATTEESVAVLLPSAQCRLDLQQNQPQDALLNIGEAVQQMAGQAFDGIVSKSVVLLEGVSAEETVAAVAKDEADEQLLVAENSALIEAGDEYESRPEAEDIPELDETQQMSVSDDMDKSTYKLGRNHTRNKKRRSNKKLLSRGGKDTFKYSKRQ